jgi:hypothetical protein
MKKTRSKKSRDTVPLRDFAAGVYQSLYTGVSHIGIFYPSFVNCGTQTDKHLSQSPFTGQFVLMTTFCCGVYTVN